MIRSNLSTRPFYNERIVRFCLLGLGALVLAATAFNIVRVIGYSRSDTTLASQAGSDEARAAELHAQANRLRGTVDTRQIARASTEAQQANELIDRRTFSWTELFNEFESTLPDEVRIASVRPQLDAKKGIVLTISVVSRSIEDVNQLMENLEGTGAFKDLLPPEQHVNDQGLLEATVEATYRPKGSRPTTPGAKQP